MAKISWNKFVEEHESSMTFLAKINDFLPKALQFDKNHKKLPTPYGLFLEWANKSLKGNWAAMRVAGIGFAITVESDADTNLITQTFGTTGIAQKTPIGNKTIQIKYSNSNYEDLAKTQGYKLLLHAFIFLSVLGGA